jgi:hypothetical protein
LVSVKQINDFMKTAGIDQKKINPLSQ